MEITKELLIHWWHYYGKLIYTLEELNNFIAIIDEKGANKVFDVATASYLCGDGSPTVLLLSIREDKVDELFGTLEGCTGENAPENECAIFQKAREELFTIVSSSFK